MKSLIYTPSLVSRVCRLCKRNCLPKLSDKHRRDWCNLSGFLMCLIKDLRVWQSVQSEKLLLVTYYQLDYRGELVSPIGHTSRVSLIFFYIIFFHNFCLFPSLILFFIPCNFVSRHSVYPFFHSWIFCLFCDIFHLGPLLFWFIHIFFSLLCLNRAIWTKCRYTHSLIQRFFWNLPFNFFSHERHTNNMHHGTLK